MDSKSEFLSFDWKLVIISFYLWTYKCFLNWSSQEYLPNLTEGMPDEHVGAEADPDADIANNVEVVQHLLNLKINFSW